MVEFVERYLGLIENIVNNPKSHNRTTMTYCDGGMDVLGAMAQETGSAELQAACKTLRGRIMEQRVKLELR